MSVLLLSSNDGLTTRAVASSGSTCERFIRLTGGSRSGSRVCSTLCHYCATACTVVARSRGADTRCSRTVTGVGGVVTFLPGTTTCGDGGRDVKGTVGFTHTCISIINLSSFTGNNCASRGTCSRLSCFTTTGLMGHHRCRRTVPCLRTCLHSNSRGCHGSMFIGLVGTYTRSGGCRLTIVALRRTSSGCPASCSVVSSTMGLYVSRGSGTGLRGFMNGNLTLHPSSRALLGVRNGLCRRNRRFRRTLSVCGGLRMTRPGTLSMLGRLTVGGCGVNIRGCGRTLRLGRGSPRVGSLRAMCGSCFACSVNRVGGVVVDSPLSLGCARTLTVTCGYMNSGRGFGVVGGGLTSLKNNGVRSGIVPRLVRFGNRMGPAVTTTTPRARALDASRDTTRRGKVPTCSTFTVPFVRGHVSG